MKVILFIKIVIGCIALCLGMVGALLPVLPTTPFVLLAVGCFSSTPAIQKRVLTIPFMREYYDSYHNKKGLSKTTVLCSLLFLWSMLMISAMFYVNLTLTLTLVLIGVLVSFHILYLSKRGTLHEE